MADAATEQAIAISTGVVSALQTAGVLHGQVRWEPADTLMPSTPPAPPQQPQVGDVHDVLIKTLWKIVATNPDSVKIQLVNAQRFDISAPQDAAPVGYILEFPPNDMVYLSEFDRLFTVDKDRPLNIQAELEITKKIGTDLYGAKLTHFWVEATF